MKLKGLSFVIIFVSAVNLVNGQINNKAKTENELTALLKEMSNAVASYDVATLDRIFTSDYVEVSPGGEFDSREKVLGFYTPEAKAKDGNPQVSVESSDYSIRVYEKFAVVIGRLTYNAKFEGKSATPPFILRFSAICRQEKGKWKIASSHYTVIKQP